MMKTSANPSTNRPDIDPSVVALGRAASPSNINLAPESDEDDSRQHATRLRNQSRAMFIVIISWMVGTCVFESLAWGEEISRMNDEESYQSVAIETLSLDQQWKTLETEISLANSGIDNFIRMEQNHLIRADLTKMIRSERAIIAMRESIKSLRKAPKNVLVDPDAVVVDPIIESMHVAKGDVARAYRKLDESSENLLLTERSSNRLAWDDAQMSALPGLIRLVAADIDDLLSPVYVEQISIDHSRTLDKGGVKTDIVAGQPAPTSEGESVSAQPSLAALVSTEEPDAVSKQSSDSIRSTYSTERPKQTEKPPVAKILRGRPNILSAVNSDTNMQTVATDEIAPLKQETPNQEVTEPKVAQPTTKDPKAESLREKMAVVPLPSDEFKPRIIAKSERLVTNETIAEPVVAETERQVVVESKVDVHPVAVEDVGPKDSASEAQPPAARVAAKWPFISEATEKQHSDKVSLNVSNTDVRTVFEMLARGYQMNILVSPRVEGTVTANIEGLTAEETLDGILKMCDLKSRNEGGVIFVYPSDGMPASAREVRVFTLDFARAQVLNPAVLGMLSPIGSAYMTEIVDVDAMRTNETIVVVDTPESIARIESYILQADQPPRQVLIEAHVLEVILEDGMTHGVNFDAIVGGDLTVGSFGLADPIAARSNPLVFAQIDGSRVDALLDTIETTTDSKTLASPRVMVVNGQHARIQVGQQLGFTVATVTETATIQDIKFLDTGVVLNVTPTISRDNQILMEVKPEVSDGQINPNTLLPEEDTREVETSVLLNNHQGVVIGGLIQETDRTVIRKLPWLGDVKHVGKLFQRRELERKRSEIIVALIPHIIEGSCAATERDAVDVERVTNPLLHGPLKRACRPWEPRLPDTVGQERHLDVNRVNNVISR